MEKIPRFRAASSMYNFTIILLGIIFTSTIIAIRTDFTLGKSPKSVSGKNGSAFDQIRLTRSAIWIASRDFESGRAIGSSEQKDHGTKSDGNRLVYERCEFSGEFDIEKLAYSVAQFETRDCSLGSGKVNNCFGIRSGQWFKSYDKKQDSYEDFKRIWRSYYQGFPNLRKAKKWTGNDRAGPWLCGVLQFYNQKL